MHLKGKVSTVDNAAHMARVMFQDRDNTTTYLIPIATHVGSLLVNDLVAIIVFSTSLEDALIIAKFPGGD